MIVVGTGLKFEKFRVGFGGFVCDSFSTRDSFALPEIDWCAAIFAGHFTSCSPKDCLAPRNPLARVV